MLQSTSPSSIGSTIQQPIPPVNSPVNASNRITMDPNGNPLEAPTSYWPLTLAMSSCFPSLNLWGRRTTTNSSDSDSDEYEISLESIKVNFKDDYIGGGTQSSVFRGILNEKTIALKKLNRASEVDIRMLKALEHPNVIRTLGVSTKDICPCIIMEYCEQGGLFDVLQRRKVTKALFCKWSSEIADGMAYLHSKKVVHRDLKSANILVDKDDNTKICDFGSLYTFDKTFMPSVVMSFVGTSQYMAPEMMKSEPCSEKVDIWSFGIVLWELLTQEIPYKGIPSMAIMYGVGSGTLKLHVPKTVPQTAKLLFKLCFSKKPRNRPSFASVASHLTNLQAEVAEMSEDAWTMRKQVWQKDIREEMSRSQNGNAVEEQNVKADELVKKRWHELRHAQEIREMYEKKMQRVDKMMRKILVIMEDINSKEMDLKQREQKIEEMEKLNRSIAYENNHSNGKHEKRRSAPPTNTCRVQKPMVVRAGSKTISGQADAEYNYDCQLSSSNYAIVSIQQHQDEDNDDDVDADSEVEAMSARSSRGSSSDEEYYGNPRRQRQSFTCDNSTPFARSSTRHSVGLPPTSSNTIRNSPKSDRNSIPAAFPSSQSDRNFQFNENNMCQSCIYFHRNSSARISGISADSGVCTSTLTLEETGQRLHSHFDNSISSTHGSPLYRNVDGRWSDGRIQTRRKPRRQSSRDSPFKNLPSKKEKHLSSPSGRIGSAGAATDHAAQHRSSRDLHAMRSMSMIESVEVAVEEDENGRLVILEDTNINNIKPSPSYQEAINASNNNPITPINNRIIALRSEFADSGTSKNTDEEIIVSAVANIMCESSSTMVSSLERSLEQAVNYSDGLTDNETFVKAARSHFKSHRRTASNPIPAIVAETSTESDNDSNAVYI
jgi:mitogen-activated protein kinase kinase kinase 13